jgi:hypothetical protein
LATPKKHKFVAKAFALLVVLIVAALAIYFIYNSPKTDDDTTPTPSPTSTPTVTPTPTSTPTPTPMPTASPTPAPTMSVFGN